MLYRIYRFILLLLIFAVYLKISSVFSQGAKNKFLQFRDFAAGMNPNGLYFVDEPGESGVEGNPYIFAKFIPSVLITIDSNKYRLDQTNISLISNNFEIIHNNQSFLFDKKLVERIDFQLNNTEMLSLQYLAVLDKYGQVLYSDRIKLLKTYTLDIKKADYRADLNVGSKTASYKTKTMYYLLNADNVTFPFDSRKDAKIFLLNNFPHLRAKDVLKKLFYKNESDLLEAVKAINEL